MVPELAIVATMSGRRHDRRAVLEWEDRRINAAAKKLGVVPPPAGPVAERREAWLEIKRALGTDELHRRLVKEVGIADRVGTLQAKLSPRRRLCLTELMVPGGSAEQFTRWYGAMTFSSDQDAMERACPDHFVLRIVDGRQEVLETNGGSPLAALFNIDYDDTSAIRTPIDPAFPFRLDGVAIAANGTRIGAVRHQFRDTPDGLHARLAVEFPLPILGRIVRWHRWHLACEFSNWIEAAIAEDLA